MKKNKYFYLVGIITLIIFVSCTINNLSSNRPIISVITIDSLFIDTEIDKVCYSPINKSFFLLNKQENSIHIYKDGVLFNIIGKSGFSEDSFRRLSDICFGVDGYLYALDSFDRSIKKFDADGKYIGSAILNQVNSPEKFAMTQYGGFFVFDGHSKEIITLDSFDFTSKSSFGKFQIDNVESMFIAGDYLNIYDRFGGISNIFFLNGLLENTYGGCYFYDIYGNILHPSNNSIIDIKARNFLFTFKDPVISTSRQRDDLIKINMENNLLIANYKQQIFVLRILYETL